MNSFIGRENEIKAIKKTLTSPKPEFLAVIGRRRVGKTYLIKETLKEEIDFILTGLQHANKPDQLQNFIYALTTFFPDFEIESKPKSWLEAFHTLSKALESRKKSKKKMVVFLDELPWLATKRSGFITGLGWFWNSWATNHNILLAVCGSAASWMIENIINDKGGLHNRVTKMLHLNPFTLAETEAFIKSKNIKLNRYHISQIYLAMGGIPMYLDQLDTGLSAVQNIQNICFSQNGYLRKEFDRLYASLFDNATNHIEVVRILASKKMGMTRQQIISKTKLTNGGMLSDILNELKESGFIEVYAGYGKKKQLSLYRLVDPYSLFYLTFIEPLSSNLKTDFTKLSDLPNYKTWSGYAFENLCLLHIDQIKKIDLLIDRGDYAINLCEMKYSNNDYTVSKSDVKNIENKKRVFIHHTKTKKHIFTTLITTHGVTENAHRLNAIDQVITLDQLFE